MDQLLLFFLCFVLGYQALFIRNFSKSDPALDVYIVFCLLTSIFPRKSLNPLERNYYLNGVCSTSLRELYLWYDMSTKY
jgi:hypothetical protein